ncbi:MAG: FG-GAP-like repeat-containing protein [Polyangia bacterium]
MAAATAGCGSGGSYTPAQIQGLTPATGPSTGGPLVRITGANFVTGDLVSFGGEPAPGSMVLSPTEITVPLPPHPGAFGPTPVSVTHPDGQAATRGDLFTYYLGSLQLASRAVSAGQGRPFTVRVGDLNADGLPDLVTGNIGDGKLSILLGQRGGGFLPPRNFVAGQQPVDTAIADFNGDGKLDVAIADRTGRGINVLIGDGQGGFPAGYRSAVSGSPLALAVGDVTKDSAAAPPAHSCPPAEMCAAQNSKTTLHVDRFLAKMT